jgi:hypothetical protein
MADKFTVSIYVAIRDGFYTGSFNPGQLVFDPETTGGGEGGGLHNVTVDESVIDFGNLTRPGLYVIHNLDTTYSVEVGSETAPGTAGEMVSKDVIPPGRAILGYVAENAVFRAKVVGSGSVEPTVRINVQVWEY